MQFEDLTQLGPLGEHADHAAIVLLEHLAQREDGEQLRTGEVLA